MADATERDGSAGSARLDYASPLVLSRSPARGVVSLLGMVAAVLVTGVLGLIGLAEFLVAAMAVEGKSEGGRWSHALVCLAIGSGLFTAAYACHRVAGHLERVARRHLGWRPTGRAS